MGEASPLHTCIHMYVHALHLFQRALAPFDDYLLPFVSMILYWTPGIGKSWGLMSMFDFQF
jgi:hypothetical protein